MINKSIFSMRGFIKRTLIMALLCLGILGTNNVFAAGTGIPALNLVTQPDGSQSYTVTIQIVALMTALTFLPALLMMMTSFTRIIIVFSILRQALGLQQTPSNQVLVGLALFLTVFIMTPVFNAANKAGIQPYIHDNMPPLEALQKASEPFKKFMLAQTRENDLALFVRLSKQKFDDPSKVSFFCVDARFCH
jgi:flagellar biosynthetic protein FliP